MKKTIEPPSAQAENPEFLKLQERIGEQNPADWSQHTNGGGWIHRSAKVDASAHVGPQAIVWGTVFGDARVFGNAQVFGDAQVSGNAWVFGDARVFGNAQVFGNAWVFGDARVFGNAQVFGDAQVSGDDWEKSPLFIIGSRHSLCNAKKGHIQIGCQCQKFDWWLSEAGETFARENGYSDEEIAEYRLYVELFKKVGK